MRKGAAREAQGKEFRAPRVNAHIGRNAKSPEIPVSWAFQKDWTMKVLVTGGSGFIGSHVVDVLLESGHGVTSIDIKPPHRGDFRHVFGSVLDRRLIDSLVKESDAVCHIAGFSNINLVKGNPVDAIELNILSTVYLLDACRRHAPHARFIYASSVYAFDRNGHLYTTSKASSERIIEDFNALYGIPYAILRYGTVYGPRNREADVVYLFVSSAIEGRPIEIHGGGEQRRNFTHVRDLAEGSVKALEKEEARNRTMVIAHARSVSIIELASMVREIVNPGVQIMFKGDKRDQDYAGVIGGLDDARDILGWGCRIPFEAGIRELADGIGRLRPSMR